MFADASTGSVMFPTDLEARILARSSSRVKDLRVTVEDDQTVVSGITHSFYARQVVEQACMEVLRPATFRLNIRVVAGR